jgi:GAF domain-containing protein
VHPSPSSPPDPLPMAELLFQRSEDPSASSPLTYREAAWAVPEGTSIAAAVRLLAGMFEGVRAALAGVKPGKLVYMAIFDHHFVGKPTRPPLATLTWKDWKDQGQGPEIRRQGEPRTSFQPPPISNSFIPAAVPQPPAMQPGQAPVSSVGAAPIPTAVAAPAIAQPVMAVPSVIIAPVAEPLPAAAAISPPAAVPSPTSAPAPAQALVDERIPYAAPAPGAMAPAAVASSASPVAAAPAPPLAEPAPAAAPVAPMLVVVPEPVTPMPVAAPRAAAPSSPAVRLSGVELIADLFECMHDLHFLPDALAGADFVLGLMLDKLPSAVALVQFYVFDAREFVVVRAVGAGAAKVMQLRTNEKEPLIAEAMLKARAVVLDDAATDPRVQNGRWALIGDPPRSIICAPVEEAGRFLGLLELSNPLDGQPFHEGDGHAITYIGEQFAEFLAAHGLVLDPERIGD